MVHLRPVDLSPTLLREIDQFKSSVVEEMSQPLEIGNDAVPANPSQLGEVQADRLIGGFDHHAHVADVDAQTVVVLEAPLVNSDRGVDVVGLEPRGARQANEHRGQRQEISLLVLQGQPCVDGDRRLYDQTVYLWTAESLGQT